MKSSAEEYQERSRMKKLEMDRSREDQGPADPSGRVALLPGKRRFINFLLLLVIVAYPCIVRCAEDVPVVRKILLPARYYAGDTGIMPQQPIDEAAWIWRPNLVCHDGPNMSEASRAKIRSREEHFPEGWHGPEFLRFRKEFESAGSPLLFHVSADERFELMLDGQRIARGPDRSDVEHGS